MSERAARVLLVEDNRDDILFFKRAWNKLGVEGELEVAEDGEAAVGRLSNDPRMTHVVLDLKLPKKAGLDVLAWLRSSSEIGSTPVIVLTSSTENADREQASRLGVDAYLIKPVNFANLRLVLRDIATRWGILCEQDPRSLPPIVQG